LISFILDELDFGVFAFDLNGLGVLGLDGLGVLGASTFAGVALDVAKYAVERVFNLLISSVFLLVSSDKLV
jgi:hypothetical protein